MNVKCVSVLCCHKIWHSMGAENDIPPRRTKNTLRRYCLLRNGLSLCVYISHRAHCVIYACILHFENIGKIVWTSNMDGFFGIECAHHTDANITSSFRFDRMPQRICSTAIYTTKMNLCACYCVRRLRTGHTDRWHSGRNCRYYRSGRIGRAAGREGGVGFGMVRFGSLVN